MHHSPDRRLLLRGLAGLATAGALPLAQADYDKIRASGALKVAVYRDFAPFSYGPAQSPKGIDVTLAGALASELKLKLDLLYFEAGENMADDLRNMVWRGHYLGYGPAHVMLHVPVDRYLMQQNRQTLIFAPYYRETVVLAHDRKLLPRVDKAEDLLGKPLAGERGTAATSALLGAAGGQLRDRVTITDSTALAVEALLAGKVAAVYARRAQIEAAFHAAGKPLQGGDHALTRLSLTGVSSDGWPVGMSVKSDASELAKALEAALVRLASSGQLQQILATEGVTPTPI